MRRTLLFPLLLAACPLLAGCMNDQPLAGHPGALGARLAQPPPARLAVPPPPEALLGQAAADALAGALADALAEHEVPAFAQQARPGDWRLVVAAEAGGGGVVPSYTVYDPTGKDTGSVKGRALPEAGWAAGDPALLKQAATEAAPQIADLLTGIDAARKMSDPNSLYNRPARVAVVPVTGAPGDGNVSLALQMRNQLPPQGEVVQPSIDGADIIVAGEVRTVPVAAGQVRVEIQWVVKDAVGHELGRVVQINEVPVGTLDHYWGEIGLAVAQQAAGGVAEVIRKQTGGRRPPPGTQPGTPPVAAAPVAPTPVGPAP